MLSSLAFDILLASAFTFGCAAIHEWREHAQLLTPILVRTAGCIAVFAVLVAIAQNAGSGSSTDNLKLRPHTGRALAIAASGDKNDR